MYGYTRGEQQPGELYLPEGQRITGNAIGVLILSVWYPLVPGSMFNASTFGFPVLFKILESSNTAQVLSADPGMVAQLITGGKELEKQGVRAVVGSCGYFANFQLEVAAALKAPTFLSSLLQAPLIHRSLRPEQKLGILCASAPSLNAGALKQCGIEDRSRIAIYGADTLPEFRNILETTGHLNSAQLEQELVGLARQMVAENPDVGAILLECGDMPPYAWTIQAATGLPVFDFTTMVSWVHSAVVRRPFPGII
ncbi:MAG: aspartate/glutamate racemase family protein [Chloroflexi bacterium]|nr:aspartate/glutamate racemase family protein [Chloroflexota bacterium]